MPAPPLLRAAGLTLLWHVVLFAAALGLPWPWQLAVAVGFAVGAWALTAPSALTGPGARAAARMGG